MINKAIVTIDDQISYLETYSQILKAQQELIELHIKFLKTGKDIQDSFKPYFETFGIFNPFIQSNKQ